MIEQISAEQARKLMDADDGYVYLDVRSEFEFEQGHAEGAFNIPLKQVNPELQMLQDNPDFLSVVQEHFPPEAKLLLGCASGNRSNVAGMILKQNGYDELSNIQGGFSGAKDVMGNLIQPGWMQLGYPVETGDGGEKGYQNLSKNSK